MPAIKVLDLTQWCQTAPHADHRYQRDTQSNSGVHSGFPSSTELSKSVANVDERYDGYQKGTPPHLVSGNRIRMKWLEYGERQYRPTPDQVADAVTLQRDDDESRKHESRQEIPWRTT